jgi:hypothetical protein
VAWETSARGQPQLPPLHVPLWTCSRGVCRRLLVVNSMLGASCYWGQTTPHMCSMTTATTVVCDIPFAVCATHALC